MKSDSKMQALKQNCFISPYVGTVDKTSTLQAWKAAFTSSYASRSVQAFITKSTEQLDKVGALNDSMAQNKKDCSIILDEAVGDL